MARWFATALSGSIVVHAMLTGALLTWVKLHPGEPPRADVVAPTEIEFTEPEPTAAPTPQPEPTVEPPPEPSSAPQPTPAAAQPTPVAPPQRSARVLTTDRGAGPNEVNPTPVPSAQPSAIDEPPGPIAPVATAQPGATGRPLSAGELFGNVDALSRAGAVAGNVDLGTPGAVPRPTRRLFGHASEGTPEDQARRAIASTIESELAPSRHMRAPGSGLLARRVGTRAEEDFAPVRTIPNLGAAVARAPVVSIPVTPHEQSAGEAAAGSELNALRGGQNPTQVGFSGPNMAPCSYRTMRAEIEVDQSPEGDVVATRVTRRSGLARLDETAERTIREAMSAGDPPRGGAGRRSQWSFEVSEAVRVPTPFCDNSGWRMLSEESNGVLLRYRVRLQGARLLPVGGAAPSGSPRGDS